MAGYRLSPRAARARRRPLQRPRRVVFGVGLLNAARTAADTVTVTDAASVTLAIWTRTAADTVTVTDSASTGGTGSANTAQGGLAFLFAQGGSSPVTLTRTATDTITVTDAATRSLTSVSSYSRSAADTVRITDAVAARFIAAGTTFARPFTSPLDVVSSTSPLDVVYVTSPLDLNTAVT